MKESVRVQKRDVFEKSLALYCSDKLIGDRLIFRTNSMEAYRKLSKMNLYVHRLEHNRYL